MGTAKNPEGIRDSFWEKSSLYILLWPFCIAVRPLHKNAGCRESWIRHSPNAEADERSRLTRTEI